jgi:hypothetical protein
VGLAGEEQHPDVLFLLRTEWVVHSFLLLIRPKNVSVLVTVLFMMS